MIGDRALRTTAPAVALAAVLIASLADPVGAAESVTTRAGLHEDFGRIVFDWPTPVEYRATFDDEKVRITFARSLATDLGQVRVRLGRYVASAVVEPDGRTVRFELIRPLDVRSFISEKTSVVLDLVEAAPAAGGAAVVQVRVGEHPGFTRLVFDWLSMVDYSVRREDDRAVVSFSRTRPIDVSGLRSDLPAGVLWAESESGADGARVSIGLPREVRLRNFRVGTKVVVDILAKADRTPDSATAQSEATAPAPDLPRPPPAEPQAASKPRQLLAGTDAPSSGKADPSGASVPVSAEAKRSFDLLPLRISSRESPSGWRLEFVWPEPVAAAMFWRADHLWAVFDRPSLADLFSVGTDSKGPILAVQKLQARGATVVRFRLRPGLRPVVRQQGASWLVDLADQAAGPVNPIEVASQPDESTGARLFLSLQGLGERVMVTDPEVGDELIIIPIAAPIRAVVIAREYLELALPATAHGVVIAPKADGLKILLLRNGIAITKDKGLLLSGRRALRLGSGTQAGSSDDRLGRLYLDFDAWRQGPSAEFNSIKQKLLNELAAAPAAERNEHRLELARFYFAHAFAAEAKAVLTSMEEHAPSLVAESGFLALRGATAFLLKRFDDAMKDFYHRNFDGNSEIAMWRAATSAEMQDWDSAHDAFAMGFGVPASYPEELRLHLLLLDGRTSLNTDDFERLDQTLNLVLGASPPALIQADAEFLRGQAQERLGHLVAAAESYRAAAKSENRPAAARAEFARVNLLLKTGELIPLEAIERLERLRYVWRGGEFEFDLLSKLGELHIMQGTFREGLSALRYAVSYFPDREETRAVTKQMNEVFERLFLDGGTVGLTPVSALGLYYEFRELTPLGPKGDEMIRRLADRLVSVDLLDRGAKLLEHQINFRVNGGEKARVGARLAVIYLLDNKPTDALTALSVTRWQPLVKSLVAQRHRLEARALADLDRFDEGLDLLAADDSRAARILRAEIYWRAENWAAAAQALETLLGERWRRTEPLEPVEARQVMKLAVSLSFADDEAALNRLRERYAKKLSNKLDADAFAVITNSVDRKAVEFRKLANRIAQTEHLEAFMASYRNKLSEGGLSAIN